MAKLRITEQNRRYQHSRLWRACSIFCDCQGCTDALSDSTPYDGVVVKNSDFILVELITLAIAPGSSLCFARESKFGTLEDAVNSKR